jgi:hypothetical protein
MAKVERIELRGTSCVVRVMRHASCVVRGTSYAARVGWCDMHARVPRSTLTDFLKTSEFPEFFRIFRLSEIPGKFWLSSQGA